MSIFRARRIVHSTIWTLLVAVSGMGWTGSEASAQQVAYSGKLQIGFGDADNFAPFRVNNAVPACAGAGPLVNPNSVGTTQGTLLVNGRATATPGVGGSIAFEAVSGATGGAQIRTPETCRFSIPGFANPRIRSRTEVGAAYFPGRKGAVTASIVTADLPLVPPIYTLSAGGGNEEAATVLSWTTMATGSGPAMSFTGAAIESTPPLWTPGNGIHRVQPGSARFGGALPFSGGFGIQLGINSIGTGGSPPPLEPGDYGIVSYQNGFLPFSPLFLGTDATGVTTLQLTAPQLMGTWAPIVPTSSTFSLGLVAIRSDATFAARTPGGTTQDQHGAIRTLAGGNTVSPATPPAPPIISPLGFAGAFGEWTTGAVTHTDMVGDFTTIRKAQGFDIVPTTGTRISNESRRIQVVSPWSAAFRPLGPFGLFLPELGFGGVAVLTLNLIPAPEPGFALMLAGGASALATARLRRRKVS